MADGPAGGTSFATVVAGRRHEATNIVSFQLLPLAAQSLPAFTAGAHVDVRVTADIVRQYSICSDPRGSGHYRLAVLAEAHSRGGSAGIHAGFVDGTVVNIGAPRNHFYLDETAGRSILLAGGIGITPLLAMAYRLSALGRDFALHYCVRSSDRAAFRDELTAGPLAPHTAIHCDDGADAQRFVLSRVLSRPAADAHVYVCGPPGFISLITEGAQRLGWPAGRVHVEHFKADVEVTGDSFVVRTAGGMTITIPPDKSIAATLAEHGVAVTLLCEQGVCGTCLTPVLEGEPEHRDFCQSAAEKAANRMIAICCSRAKSAVLVLDL